MKKLLLIITAITTLLFSCKKDKNTSVTPTPIVPKYNLTLKINLNKIAVSEAWLYTNNSRNYITTNWGSYELNIKNVNSNDTLIIKFPTKYNLIISSGNKTTTQESIDSVNIQYNLYKDSILYNSINTIGSNLQYLKEGISEYRIITTTIK